MLHQSETVGVLGRPDVCAVAFVLGVTAHWDARSQRHEEERERSPESRSGAWRSHAPTLGTQRSRRKRPHDTDVTGVSIRGRKVVDIYHDGKTP